MSNRFCWEGGAGLGLLKSDICQAIVEDPNRVSSTIDLAEWMTQAPNLENSYECREMNISIINNNLRVEVNIIKVYSSKK